MDSNFELAKARAGIKVSLEKAQGFLSKGFLIAAAGADTGTATEVLDAMIAEGFIEQAPEGLCSRGKADQLRRYMAAPKKSRSDFDGMTPTQQMAFIKSGGIVT